MLTKEQIEAGASTKCSTHPELRVCPVCNQEMHPSDHTARIAELEHQNAVLRDAHQRANAESLRLAELLNKAAPDWGSPMRLT